MQAVSYRLAASFMAAATPSFASPPTGACAWRLDALGAMAVLAFSGLAWISRGKTQVPLGNLFVVLGIAWGATLAGWWISAQLPASAVLRRLWLWAILLRLTGLCAEPVLEDDYWRYLWDGRVFAVTGNPYATKPMDHFNDPSIPPTFQRALDNINHPDIPTIYGPGCQFAFLLSYWIAPGQVWPLKLLLIVADLLTLRLLLSFTSPRNALLYAWCPLLIQETAFTAHPDSLAILFAVGALVGARNQRWLVTAACLGLAVSTRVFAWLLVPYVLWLMPRKHWMTFVATVALMNLPFWWRGSFPGLEGTAAFVQNWEFNATIHAALQWTFNPPVAKAACALAFLCAYAACFWKWHCSRSASSRPFLLPRGDLVFGAFFLLSAVVNPWYLLWLLPFVAKNPTATGVTALVAVSLSYAHGLHLPGSNLAPYQLAAWVRPAEFGAVLLAALWDNRRGLRLIPAKREAG